MRVIVLSASTGELVWDYTSGSFWQARGWELRMWLCEAIHCAQYFSIILLVGQLLLCDLAHVGEYADGNILTVYMLRRGISMREEGSNDPIFVAIQMSSAENVHRLLQYSANPRSREAIPSREGHAGRRRLRRRTALEAAASHPRCRLVLLDFIWIS